MKMQRAWSMELQSAKCSFILLTKKCKTMKTIIAIIVFFITFSFANNDRVSVSTVKANNGLSAVNLPDEETKIQVAILLDASNSMDGLIEQAKSRLWNIVNTLTTLKYNGKTPGIEIALYMYGNDGLPSEENYIRKITPFTSNLDLISEKLFAITTYGGSEYCGAVIDDAVKNLDWGDGQSNMKLIYIAGNEEFTQGSTSYLESISAARKKDIFVNTIHCGSYSEGVNGAWKDGADKGKGKYFCINPDEKIVYIVTPYDEEINTYNIKLNKTYIFYGVVGETNFTNQSVQDQNAMSISSSNNTERVVSKSQAIYNNRDWDLVDKNREDPNYLKQVDKNTLPKEYQNLTTTQLQAEIDNKTKERNEIQNEISALSKKRQDYIDAESKKNTSVDDFGNAINTSILEFAKIKGYTSE
jgi:hypothetical protein